MKSAAVPERVKGVCCPPSIPFSIAKVDASVNVLKALADPTRLQMVGVLKRSSQPICVCDFTAAFDLSQPTISHHMGKLRDAGLVEVTKVGIWAYYRLAGHHVHPMVADAMREIGIDISGNRPQKLTDDLAQWADVVVTMGCGDECPYVPGKRYIDWDLTDPADKPLAEVRVIRDHIKTLVSDLVGELDDRPTPKPVSSAN